MEKQTTTSPICIRCKSPAIAPVCEGEIFDFIEAPLCKSCQDWYNDRSKGPSRDAKTMALYLLKENYNVHVIDKQPNFEHTNFEIVMDFDLRGDHDITYFTIKPIADTSAIRMPTISHGSISVKFQNKEKDLLVDNPNMPKLILDIFEKTKSY